MGKVWDKTSVLTLLDRSDKAVLRAIVAIYQRQTRAEREGRGTIERNGMGFGAYDGEYLSTVAEKLLDRDFVVVTP